METEDKPPGKDSGAPQDRAEREERPFDHWLRKQLHAMYDDVAKEPLPTDLLKMIEDDGKRAKQAGPTDPGAAGPKDPRRKP